MMDELEGSHERLRADVWVGAFIRRVEHGGGFAALTRRGDDAAGAIFVEVIHAAGVDLYGPLPMARARRFECLVNGASSYEVFARLEREARFDSDLWIVSVEDVKGRSFLLENECG